MSSGAFEHHGLHRVPPRSCRAYSKRCACTSATLVLRRRAISPGCGVMMTGPFCRFQDIYMLRDDIYAVPRRSPGGILPSPAAWSPAPPKQRISPVHSQLSRPSNARGRTASCARSPQRANRSASGSGACRPVRPPGTPQWDKSPTAMRRLPTQLHSGWLPSRSKPLRRPCPRCRIHKAGGHNCPCCSPACAASPWRAHILLCHLQGGRLAVDHRSRDAHRDHGHLPAVRLSGL